MGLYYFSQIALLCTTEHSLNCISFVFVNIWMMQYAYGSNMVFYLVRHIWFVYQSIYIYIYPTKRVNKLWRTFLMNCNVPRAVEIISLFFGLTYIMCEILRSKIVMVYFIIIVLNEGRLIDLWLWKEAFGGPSWTTYHE